MKNYYVLLVTVLFLILFKTESYAQGTGVKKTPPATIAFSNPGTSVFGTTKPATLTLSNLSYTYDGSAKSATVITSPKGLSGVVVYYNGSAAPPVHAGKYAVRAILINESYDAPAIKDTLVITKHAATLTFSNLGQTYDGLGKTATVTTSPVGLSGVTVTYNGSVTPPVHAGSYTISASLKNQDYVSPEIKDKLIISRQATTLTFSNLSQIYDGSKKSATVITSPKNLSGVTVTYNGSANLPVHAGKYEVLASLINLDYTAPSIKDSLVISRHAATLTLSNLTQVYNGSGKTATVTTSPNGLGGVTVTYNGLATHPFHPGKYAVLASLTNPDYTAASVKDSLTINKQPAIITVNNLIQIYNGFSRFVEVTTSPRLLNGITVTYNGSASPPTQVGKYAVLVSLTNPIFAAPSVKDSLVISRQVATLTLSNLTQVYKESGNMATVLTSPKGLTGVTVTYNGLRSPPAHAGKYLVVASLLNPNFSALAVKDSLVISRQAATLTLSNLTQTYNGSEKSATVTTSPKGLTGVNVTYEGSGAVPTRAGSYQVRVSLVNANYSALPVSGILSINKQEVTLRLSNLSQVYDGAPKPVTLTTSLQGLTMNRSFTGTTVTYNGSIAIPSLVGQYMVVASLLNPNYSAISVMGIMYITAKKIPGVQDSHQPADTTVLAKLVHTSMISAHQIIGSPVDLIAASNLLSPNGDGHNDTWEIKNIMQYPSNKVLVYDRIGRIVFSANSYTNTWGGTFQGRVLEKGTYYYIVDLGPGNRKFRGFITLIN